MKKNDSIKLKSCLINYIDILGVGYNFLVEGVNKKKTMGGAILSLLYGLIFIGLFFGFGIDLYQRKRPKASFNTAIGEYKEIPLSNTNFTYAYRVEDRLANIILDESIIYQLAVYFKFTLVNGTWNVDFYKSLENKRCHELPNIKEKEKYYNRSLYDWYCIDFDNITLGGNWDGNVVQGIIVNTYQCMNSTTRNNCASQDVLKQSFVNDIVSSNFFYSQLSMEVLSSMDNFENPLKTNLVNQYELLNIGITKRNIQTFKSTKMINDIGWFFSDENEISLFSGDTIASDFTFKDTWTQDILYSKFLYFGKKEETYNRSYTKIQEIFAAIGGFAKFFYFLISLFYFAIKEIYSNIFLMNNFIFENTEEESFCEKNEKSRSYSESKINLVEDVNKISHNHHNNHENLPEINSNNKENSVQIGNYLNDRQKFSHTAKNTKLSLESKIKTQSFPRQNLSKVKINLPASEVNHTNSSPEIKEMSSKIVKDCQNTNNNMTFNNVKSSEKNKISVLEFSNITFYDYFKYRCICKNKKNKNSLINTKLKSYVLCEKLFKNKLDILSYFELHNQFKHFTKLFLEKEDRKLLKNIPLKLNKYLNKDINLNNEVISLNNENPLQMQQQVVKLDNNKGSSDTMNL